MKDKDCIFCKIVRGEIPSFKIYENSEFLAILDIAQFVEGHTIVIPKQHYEFIWDVPNIGGYFEFVKSIGNHYRELGYAYVDTLTFGRMVKHAHVHLIPHNEDDKDWDRVMSEVDNLQLNESKRISSKKGEKIKKKFEMK
jgi:histidine triad (HIT) family protein